MTRHTVTTRSSKARLVLEVSIERDETSGYRHPRRPRHHGPQCRADAGAQREALEKLAVEIASLASSAGAEAGAVAERMAVHAHYDAEVARFGVDRAAERMRARLRGVDPDNLLSF